MKRFKFLIGIIIYIILCVSGFNMLIVQQEEILRTYFITSPQQRMKEYHLTLSDSLYKYFVRENKDADLPGVEDYIKKYGRTSLFETVFIFKNDEGKLFQIAKSGIEPIAGNIVDVRTDKVFPVSIGGGAIDGYLMIMIKDTGDSEYGEGLKRYRLVSLSLRILFLLFVFAIAIIALYHNYSRKIRLARDIAEARASNDGLTGLFTHAYFIKLLQIEIEKFKIYGLPMGLIMIDVDKFKVINDDYGHVAGDEILQEVSRAIKSSTRSTDICARYGGEEFSVLMPSAYTFDEKPTTKNLENFALLIQALAERIRKSVEDLQIALADGRMIRVTVSIGISFCFKRRTDLTPTLLLEKADAALYKAKQDGRNRIVIDSDSVK